MLKVRFLARFKKDYKIIQKRGYDTRIFEAVVDMLRQEIPLPPRYQDHVLKGNYSGFRECHLTPDWLLIYKVENEILTLTLTRTGTHSDLF